MQVTFTMTGSTTLADLLALQLYRVDDEVHRVVDQAVKEMAIEKVQCFCVSLGYNENIFLPAQ